jgi:hypothetical protein
MSPVCLIGKQVPQLLRQPMRNIRSSMKLRRSILKECNPPGTVVFCSDERLDRVGSRIEVHLSWWHHPYDCPEKRNIRSEYAHLTDFADVYSGLVVGKDLADLGLNLCLPIHLTSIETDRTAVLSKQRGETTGVALVPRLQQLLVQSTDFALTSRRRVLGANSLYSHGAYSFLAYNAGAQMSDTGRFDDPRAFELDRRCAEVDDAPQRRNNRAVGTRYGGVQGLLVEAPAELQNLCGRPGIVPDRIVQCVSNLDLATAAQAAPLSTSRRTYIHRS